MAAVPGELWLTQGDDSDHVSVMVVSVPGRREQHSHFPQLLISLPVQEDAGTHLNFAPSPHLLLLGQNSGVLQHHPVFQKLRELPKVLKPSKEQRWLCKPSPSSLSRNFWGFEVPRMSCWLQSLAPGSLVVLMNG